ncbi:hypothetical protein ACFL03_01775 [Thermodesulfobacteriota bacterium]
MFKISFYRNKANLNLKLMGVFDGSSAYELINTLKEHYGKVGKIVIHTCGLAYIHPFGLKVFHKKWSELKNISYGITFTGKHRYKIAPPGSNLL